MSKHSKVKSGFTKTGFSRSFSCCSSFAFCDMGKGDCYFAEVDPEVQESCHAWVRNHKNRSRKLQETIVDKPTAVVEELFHEDEIGQLSLFD